MGRAAKIVLTIVRITWPWLLRLGAIYIRLVALAFAGLWVGFPTASRMIAETWQAGLPTEIIVSAWGKRLHVIYTILAWVILLGGLVLQSLLVAWVVTCLL